MKSADSKMQKLMELMENNSKLNQELIAKMDNLHKKVLRLKVQMENPRSLGE